MAELKTIRFILPFLLMICFASVHAQNISVKISAGDNSLTVVPDSANNNKSLIIKKSQTGYLNINVVNEDTAWQRQFFIVNDAGNDIEEAVLMKPEEYCILIKRLMQNLQLSKNYFLYMSSRPKDLQKAMLVKVPRKLICVIRIEN